MNLIEAWNKNRKGKWHRKHCASNYFFCEFKNFKEIVNCIINEYGDDSYVLADDWEIIKKKEKKKVVIEDVYWCGDKNGGTYPTGGDFSMNNKKGYTQFLDKPKMKMTLEWEE